MAGGKLYMMIGLVVVVFSVAIAGKSVVAQTHHVVGGDRGWDPSSDLASWSSGRIFTVGDKIWFTYSAAQDKIVEVKSKEEYEACDVSNPIKMYTDGLDRVTLDEEGIRYFASGKAESCKNGLKLHVEVQPHAKHVNHTVVTTSDGSASSAVVADGPTSATTHLNGLSLTVFVGLLLGYLGL
ncbi:hypothetical protein ACSBR1_015402 [Camellia fascicularis]